jgi:hypothetical protein
VIARYLPFLLLLTGCVSSPDSLRQKWKSEEKAQEERPLAYQGDYKATIGRWTLQCSGGKRDAFGDIRESKYCWALISSVGNEDPLKYNMIEIVFRIDTNGLHVPPPQRRDSLCRWQPVRMAVDGSRIDNLAKNEQVERLKQGTTFLREEAGSWPSCGEKRHKIAMLHQTREVVDALIQMWGKYSAASSTER